MKKLLFVVFASALALLASADERELMATMVSSPSFEVSNCAFTSGPVRVPVTFFIENGLDQLLGVNYSYFDNSTGTWKEAGKMCNIPPNEQTQCGGNISFTLGGSGNGTFTSDMVRLTATSDAFPGDTFVKTFKLTVRHYVGEREGSLLVQMDGQVTALEAARSQCENTTACCGPQLTAGLDSADALLSGAADSLRECDFSGMLSKLQNAESVIDGAAAQIANCTPAASPTPARTPTPQATQTPASTQTATPEPQETQNPATPEPSETEVPVDGPSNSSCPLGLALLLGGLGFAAAKEAL
jgi:hypothetical protein